MTRIIRNDEEDLVIEMECRGIARQTRLYQRTKTITNILPTPVTVRMIKNGPIYDVFCPHLDGTRCDCYQNLSIELIVSSQTCYLVKNQPKR